MHSMFMPCVHFSVSPFCHMPFAPSGLRAFTRTNENGDNAEAALSHAALAYASKSTCTIMYSPQVQQQTARGQR